MHSSCLRAALIGAMVCAASLAAVAAPSAPPVQAATDESALCSSLAGEWKIAEVACSTNANLGRARARAHEAEAKCKSPDAAQRKLGLSKYQFALRLCRKPDATPKDKPKPE